MNTSSVTSSSASLNQTEIKTISIDPTIERIETVAKKAIDEGWEMISTNLSKPPRYVLTQEQIARIDRAITNEKYEEICQAKAKTPLYSGAIVHSLSGKVRRRKMTSEEYAMLEALCPASEAVHVDDH